MDRARSSSVSFALKTVILCILALMLAAVVSRQGARSQSGQIWRRGFVSGEQIHLFDDKRYVRSRWCYVCSDEAIESGTWAGLGEVVSLVPYRSGESPHLMRKISRDGKRFLAARGQSSPASDEAMFVLVD